MSELAGGFTYGQRLVDPSSGRTGVVCGVGAEGRVLVMFDDALTTGAVPVLASLLRPGIYIQPEGKWVAER